MKKLYIIKIVDNDSGLETIFSHAFTNEANAIYYVERFNYCRGHISTASVYEIKLPFIGRSVCYINGYYGIGGGFGGPYTSLVDNSQIYSCANDAKHDPIWQKAMTKVSDNPNEKYHVTDTMIATDDFGEPFIFGYGGFNVSVRHIRVIKAAVYRKYIEW